MDDENKRSTLALLLKDSVTAVFDNEENFISRFLSEYGDVEIISFYMASERCMVAYLLSDGTTVSTTITTTEFLDWCEEL